MKRKPQKPCDGTGKAPFRRYFQVGICPDCGVRTFLDGNDLIQSHIASAADVREFSRKGVTPDRLKGITNAA